MQRNTLNSHFPIATPDRSACSIFCRQLLPASACNVHRWICRLWCRRALVSQLRNSQFPCHNIWLLYAHFCAKKDWHCGGLNVTTQKNNGKFRFDLLVVGSHDFAYRFGSVIVINGADEKKNSTIEPSLYHRKNHSNWHFHRYHIGITLNVRESYAKEILQCAS